MRPVGPPQQVEEMDSGYPSTKLELRRADDASPRHFSEPLFASRRDHGIVIVSMQLQVSNIDVTPAASDIAKTRNRISSCWWACVKAIREHIRRLLQRSGQQGSKAAWQQGHGLAWPSWLLSIGHCAMPGTPSYGTCNKRRQKAT